MPNPRPTHAWKISEVQRLVELPRRDIQRACYEGQGGVGILSPADSTWGHRTYSCEDLAKLLVTSELRREGLSLPEVRQEFDRAAEQGLELTALLEIWVNRLREQEEDLHARLLKAEALRAKLLSSGSSEKDGVERLVEARVASCTMRALPLERVREGQQAVTACLHELRGCMERGEAAGSEIVQSAMAVCARTCDELAGEEDRDRTASALLESVLNDPGMDLALDLWLGSGTWEYAVEVWEMWDERKGSRE